METAPDPCVPHIELLLQLNMFANSRGAFKNILINRMAPRLITSASCPKSAPPPLLSRPPGVCTHPLPRRPIIFPLGHPPCHPLQPTTTPDHHFSPPLHPLALIRRSRVPSPARRQPRGMHPALQQGANAWGGRVYTVVRLILAGAEAASRHSPPRNARLASMRNSVSGSA